MLDPEFKKEWANDLRSGKFPQGKNALKTNKGYCCLLNENLMKEKEKIKISLLREILKPGVRYKIEWPNFPEAGIRTVLKQSAGKMHAQKLNQTGPRSLTSLNWIKTKAFKLPLDEEGNHRFELYDEDGHFATITPLIRVKSELNK